MYILERAGWSQWYDDGGRWVSNRDSAREYPTRAEAEAEAFALNAEFAAQSGGPVQADVVVVAK